MDTLSIGLSPIGNLMALQYFTKMYKNIYPFPHTRFGFGKMHQLTSYPRSIIQVQSPLCDASNANSCKSNMDMNFPSVGFAVLWCKRCRCCGVVEFVITNSNYQL